MKRLLAGFAFLVIFAGGMPEVEAAGIDDYVGRWALTIPGGGAGWLGVTKEDGYYDASILWGGGSVVPTSSVYMDGDTLVVTRTREVQRKNAEGKVVRRQMFTETIRAERSGDSLALTQEQGRRDGKGMTSRAFTGKLIPPIPPTPNLSKLKFGDPVPLLKGDSLDGWTLTNARQKSGWSVENGVLTNDPVQTPGKPHVSYGNLRTVDEFEDFKLSLEVMTSKGSNSGIYLRGIYEVQVLESFGKGLDSHNMGAVYSRITPSSSEERPPGEWQTMDMTLVDRHITVVLNGTTIIDNAPLLGCTGGAMTSDEFKPGPIYLQGDHTAVRYRNIVLRPVKN